MRSIRDSKDRSEGRSKWSGGLDVGKTLHVTVAFKPRNEVLQVCYLARVSYFSDVQDICRRFNCQSLVADLEPEMRKVKEFAQAESFSVFLADYADRTTSACQWDEKTNLVRVKRTWLLDCSHNLFIQPGALILLRRSEELDLFTQQCRRTAKILTEDLETGDRTFSYRKLGPNHYKHSISYCLLASQRIGQAASAPGRKLVLDHAQIDFDPFHHTAQRENPWR